MIKEIEKKMGAKKAENKKRKDKNGNGGNKDLLEEAVDKELEDLLFNHKNQ